MGERTDLDVQYVPSRNRSTFSNIRVDYGQCGYGLQLMAECTALLYGSGQVCGCWQKLKNLEASGMKVSVLQHANSCLLGFSGQVGGQDAFERGTLNYIREHDPVWSETVCGSQAPR